MIELSKEQIEKRNYYYVRLKGRQAVISNPYFTKLESGDRISIHNYIEEKGLFKVLKHDSGNYDYCLPDEFNLIDKEFSDFKIIKKGVRTERKDKFGDKFMLELQNNKRDIYLSCALSSLLNLNEEENYVGFANDPDTGNMYIFMADKVSGYPFNKDNNRITSIADWREMNKIWDVTHFNVIPQPIIDNNNPGFIFYTVIPNYNYTENTIPQVTKPEKRKKKMEFLEYENPVVKQAFKYSGDKQKLLPTEGVFSREGIITNDWLNAKINIMPSPPTYYFDTLNIEEKTEKTEEQI